MKRPKYPTKRLIEWRSNQYFDEKRVNWMSFTEVKKKIGKLIWKEWKHQKYQMQAKVTSIPLLQKEEATYDCAYTKWVNERRRSSNQLQVGQGSNQPMITQEGIGELIESELVESELVDLSMSNYKLVEQTNSSNNELIKLQTRQNQTRWTSSSRGGLFGIG